MATTATEAAVRNYLLALRDPSALRDDAALDDLRRQIEEADDGIERLLLRERLNKAETPPVEEYEQAFVEHAKAWAEDHGVSDVSFRDEGVPSQVLRRAGFRAVGGRGGRRGAAGRRTSTRTRVSSEEVRNAIPKGAFTLKMLQERSGASYGVVRKVIQEELGASNVTENGTDPNHTGPGRAPTLYQRA